MSRPEVNPASERSRLRYMPAPIVRDEHAESAFTRMMENQAAKVPSNIFLFLAMACLAASIALEVAGKRRLGQVVAHWPSILLIMGVYNKLVKTFGAR